MKRETVRALSALNQAFYASIAPEWSETRRHAWPGFARLLEVAIAERARAPGATLPRPWQVLDVGAGDGRFAAYLHEHCALPVRYLGIDASEALLGHARRRALGPDFRFERADFIEQPLPAALPAGPFELVLLLGVLHHVPSLAGRAQLLSALAERLDERGILALTFWRLDRDARFARRLVEFAAYNARAAQPIAEHDLEPGDTLLAWGAGSAPPRYCHFPDSAETEALIAATGLRVLERFHADGRSADLNEYALLIK